MTGRRFSRAPVPKAYSTDLSHFVGDDGLLTDGPAGRLARYFAHIVEVGSAAGCDGWFDSALPCRHRRRGGRACDGYLETLLAGNDSVQWRCPVCGENGVVTGWSKGVWDLSWARKPDRNGTIEVILHDDELSALREAEVVSTETPEVAAQALRRDGRVVITGTEDRLVELLDCVDTDLIKPPSRVRAVLEPVRWRLVAAIPSDLLWRRLAAPEPLSDSALLEREHEASWLRARIDILMGMADSQWRSLRLFVFALNELLANVTSFASREPLGTLVVLEHYITALPRVFDTVHDETELATFALDLVQKALVLGACHRLDLRHFISRLLRAAAVDDTCRLDDAAAALGDADLALRERGWVRAEATRLAVLASGERREMLNRLVAQVERAGNLH